MSQAVHQLTRGWYKVQLACINSCKCCLATSGSKQALLAPGGFFEVSTQYDTKLIKQLQVSYTLFIESIYTVEKLGTERDL